MTNLCSQPLLEQDNFENRKGKEESFTKLEFSVFVSIEQCCNVTKTGNERIT